MRWLLAPRHRTTRDPVELTQGRRGTHLLPEVGLPEGFTPPSAALGCPERGMYLDPRQIPVTLMEPAMEAGQAPDPAAAIIGYKVAGKLYRPEDVMVIRAMP